MRKRITAVDEYIGRSEPFARPILKELRSLFHRADPRITEAIKWGVPHFEYRGVLGSMAAFRKHVSIGFWKGGMLVDSAGLFESAGNRKMVMLRMHSMAEIPPRNILLRYIREAVDLNEKGVAIPRRKRSTARVVVPAFLRKTLKQNKKAADFFRSLSKSHQKEYVEWLTEAKREETRQRRLATALEWLSEGKARNWKYMQ